MPYKSTATYNESGHISKIEVLTPSSSFHLDGAVFGLVKYKPIIVNSKKSNREYVDSILGELIPHKISINCKSNNIRVPIPSKENLFIRMGFQGHTLRVMTYLHKYPLEYYRELYPYVEDDDLEAYRTYMDNVNSYDKWSALSPECLIKVMSNTDHDSSYNLIIPSDFGTPKYPDLDDIYNTGEYDAFYSVIPEIKFNSYWYIRNIEVSREASFLDNYLMELELTRSWMWSTTNRPRLAYDIDDESNFTWKSSYIWPDDYETDRKEYKSDV